MFEDFNIINIINYFGVSINIYDIWVLSLNIVYFFSGINNKCNA